MASRLAVRFAKTSVQHRIVPRSALFSRSYAVTSSPVTPSAKVTQRAAPKAASRANTYATAAEAEAEYEALANSNGGGSSSASEGSPSVQTPVDGVDPFPAGPGDTPPGSLTDWSRSYHGLGAQPFPKEAAEVLLAPIDPNDIEMKPDGLAYLPEIKYRRVLNKAFGPGGWGLAPRSETNVGPKVVSREYGLICLGRLVAVARGEQEYFDASGVATALEACKSNALMRCCKDLGVASELWDPRFLREFKAKYCTEVFAEHVTTKKKKKLYRRKDQPKFDYPWKE